MAKELKTRETEASVEDFLKTVAAENVRADCLKIIEFMSKATGEPPKMWGESCVGFGKRSLKYASGRELDWMRVGFAPRKQNISLYLSTGEDWNPKLLAKLGKHKTGMGCLYIKRLSDVNEDVLKEMIEESVSRSTQN